LPKACSLGWASVRSEIHELQAAAAVGQMGLAQVYESQFSPLRHSHRAGPADARRPGRSRALSERALHVADAAALGVVPIINENDTVVTDEIKFGDNDTLGALVANLIEGDALIILTDQRGCSPPIRARTRTPRSSRSAGGTPELEAMAGAGVDRPRRHADQDPGGQARGEVRRAHDHRERGEADVLGGWPRRGDRHATAGADRAMAARKQWMADHLRAARGDRCRRSREAEGAAASPAADRRDDVQRLRAAR
jgi:glutamate 5-kinase